MTKTKFSLLAFSLLICAAAFGAVPSFDSFDPVYFSSNNFKITLRTNNLPSGTNSSLVAPITSANTNRIYLALSSISAINGVYDWSGTAYTNGHGEGIVYNTENGPGFELWEVTNSTHAVNANPIADTGIALRPTNVNQMPDSWENSGVIDENLTSAFSTNSGTIAANLGVCKGDGSSLTNDFNFQIPVATSNALVAQYWGTNTVFVAATNSFSAATGLDAVAVVGNPSKPFGTLTNAYAAMPMNGVIWMLPGEHWVRRGGAPALIWSKNGTIVALAATIRVHADMLTRFSSGRMEIWGGVWDTLSYQCTLSLFNWNGITAGLVTTNAPTSLLIHYANLIGNADVFYPLGFTNSISVSIEHSQTFTISDTYNSGGAPTVFEISADACRFVANATTSDGTFLTSVRNFYVPAGAGVFRFNNCDFISMNQVGATNTCFWDNNGGATSYFRDCRMLGGTGATNFLGLLITGASSRAIVTGSRLVNTLTTGGGSILYAYDSWPYAVTSQSANYAVLNTDSVILLNGNLTATLPTAVGIPGKSFTIICKTAGTNGILTTSAQTLLGYGSTAAAKWTNSVVGRSTTVMSDGANWIVTKSDN